MRLHSFASALAAVLLLSACPTTPPIVVDDPRGTEGEGEGEGEGEAAGERACDDLLDDDSDGRTDCDDVDCSADVVCTAGTGATGSACTTTAQCVGDEHPAVCRTEAALGVPGGACSTWCDAASNDCPADSYCLENNNARSFCVPRCDPTVLDDAAAGCRDGFVCAPFALTADNTIGVCVPGCSSDAQCPVRGACYDNVGQAISGTCVTPEVCTGGNDDDSDGRVDCEDEDCSCDAAIAATCADTDVLALDVDVTGTTTGGTQVLSSSCTGNFLGHERVLRVRAGEAGTTGVLQVQFTGEADLGLALREVCDDATSEVACADNAGPEEGEFLLAAIEGGVDYALIVDAITAQDVGDYTLRATFTADVCGDGVITGAENCDDGPGPAVDGDGCSARCLVELDVVCAAAEALTTSLRGDTRLGRSAVFQGSCTLPQNTANEQLYVFTAARSGIAQLQIASIEQGRDLAIYVRTTCGDADSEVACADNAREGGSEFLAFPVVAGTSYTVVVDGTLSSPFDDSTYFVRLTQP
jgi:cysteine-rich repeat protein